MILTQALMISGASDMESFWYERSTYLAAAWDQSPICGDRQETEF